MQTKQISQRVTIRSLRNRDLARLGFLALIQRDDQHAVVELGIDGLLIDGRRKREAAQETRITALVQQQFALAIAALLLFAASLGGDRQRLVFQRDIDLLFLVA